MMHSSDVPLNPYQPTLEIPDEEVQGPDPLIPPRLSNGRLFWMTSLSVVASGAGFGFLLTSVMTAGLLLRGGGLGELVLLPFFGAFVGSILGLVSGAPVTAVMTAASASVRADRRWDLFSVRRFAFLCGGFSGFLSVAVPGSFQGQALVVGIVPAIFGGIASMLLTAYLVRNYLVEGAPQSREPRTGDTLAR